MLHVLALGEGIRGLAELEGLANLVLALVNDRLDVLLGAAVLRLRETVETGGVA